MGKGAEVTDGFGERLSRLIAGRGYGHDELAARVGVSRAHIAALAAGKGTVSLVVLRQLAYCLRARAEWLATGTGPIEDPMGAANRAQLSAWELELLRRMECLHRADQQMVIALLQRLQQNTDDTDDEKPASGVVEHVDSPRP